jgi:predicted N-acetyltransferase YhbS
VTDFAVRAETGADHARVEQIHALAFGRQDEAALVRALRATAHPLVSLVAEQRGDVVGHVLVSPVSLARAHAPLPAAGLAPLAVALHSCAARSAHAPSWDGVPCSCSASPPTTPGSAS